LIIKPTLQDEKLINENNVIDLQKQGICTSDVWKDCHAVTNTTNGTIVNPAKSARINTKKGMSIQFGRVEVTAAIPEGDWLWPAIWMMPVDDKYGAWPVSRL
jgi:beta-glucanase (GH16 family)